MDLNLYLGLPHSLPSLGLADYGSDLSLSVLSSSAPVEGRGAAIPMSGAVEPSESHPPYSPSHAEYSPDLLDALPSHVISSPEYTPYFPSFELYGPRSSTSLILPAVQEAGGAVVAYSPTSVEPLPVAQESIDPSLDDDDSQPYDPTSPPIFPPEAVAYLPSYFTGSSSSQVRETSTFSFHPPIPSPTDEFLAGEGGGSSRREPIRYPETFFERLMDSSHRRPIRRFRSSLTQVDERSTFDILQLPIAERAGNGTASSQRTTEGNGKHKVTADDNAAEASEEEGKEKGRNAANFECYICFDMAAEPVVTSCGHLFCWPCLYEWLHVHSDHKECPVCKGEVNDSQITPIYGRGGSPSRAEKENEKDVESALKIPPRPSGNRFESIRQQFWPVSRRLGDGIAASWRHFLYQHVHGANRHEPYAEPSVQEIYENVHRRALIRLRARRLQREIQPENGSVAGELGLAANNVANPIRSTVDPIFQDGIDFWQPFERSSDRIAAITADFGRVVGRFPSGGGLDRSTSSLNPTTETPTIWARADAALAPEASVSSTMAMIQGDVATSAAPADPNSVGSSRNNRRRGRSSTSGSLDVDGDTIHSHKRRARGRLAANSIVQGHDI